MTMLVLSINLDKRGFLCYSALNSSPYGLVGKAKAALRMFGSCINSEITPQEGAKMATNKICPSHVITRGPDPRHLSAAVLAATFHRPHRVLFIMESGADGPGTYEMTVLKVEHKSGAEVNIHGGYTSTINGKWYWIHGDYNTTSRQGTLVFTH